MQFSKAKEDKKKKKKGRNRGRKKNKVCLVCINCLTGKAGFMCLVYPCNYYRLCCQLYCLFLSGNHDCVFLSSFSSSEPRILSLDHLCHVCEWKMLPPRIMYIRKASPYSSQEDDMDYSRIWARSFVVVQLYIVASLRLLTKSNAAGRVIHDMTM